VVPRSPPSISESCSPRSASPGIQVPRPSPTRPSPTRPSPTRPLAQTPPGTASGTSFSPREATIISRPPSRPPGRVPSGMSPWLPPNWPPTEPPHWQAGWPAAASPWALTPQEAALRMGVYPPGSFPLPPSSSWPVPPTAISADPASAAFPFSRPGLAHPREHLIQRAVQPGFLGARPDLVEEESRDPLVASPRPPEVKVEQGINLVQGGQGSTSALATFGGQGGSGAQGGQLAGVSTSSSPSTSAHSSASVSPRGSTLITRQTPDPGEVTIEKEEQSWGGATPGPSSGWATPRPTLEQPRPSARRSRMRDLISSAVRSALSNQSLEDEAERFNNQMGSTFASTLGSPVKKEK